MNTLGIRDEIPCQEPRENMVSKLVAHRRRSGLRRPLLTLPSPSASDILEVRAQTIELQHFSSGATAKKDSAKLVNNANLKHVFHGRQTLGSETGDYPWFLVL